MTRSVRLGERGGDWGLALGVGGLAFLVYVLTLAPGLTFEHYGTDGGDLVAAAYNLGVPHPTGYPTYTLLAWLFTRLPVGVVAYRTNLLSAVCAAGAVVFLFRSARLLLPAPGRFPLLPAATALTYAFSSLLWSQAVITEVYALLAFFAALIFWLLLRWRAGGGDHYLWLAALCLGLGLGNHVTLVFVAPAALLLLWSQRSRWLRLGVLFPALVFFSLGLGIYAYLPLAARARPPVNWGYPVTWDRFLWVVTAHQYQAFAFGLNPADMPGRLAAWLALLGRQFGWWGLALALAGGVWGWRRDRALVAASLTWILLVVAYAFFYDTLDSHVYLLPPFMLLALAWGEGALGMLRMVRARRPAWLRPALAVVALLPILSLGLHWAQADPDDDWQVHAYISQALEDVAPRGLVVVRGDGPTFALWYGIYAEGVRQDVAVVSGPLLAFIWYRDQVRHQYPDLVLDEPHVDDEVTINDLVRDLIAHNLDRHPVYATDPAQAWYDWFDFVKEEGDRVYRAVPLADRLP